MRIISFFNHKGGVGKTTSTINVAANLVEAGKSVLVIDLDPQANLTVGLGLDSKNVGPNVSEMLRGESRLEQCIVTCHGIDVIGSHVDRLTNVEMEMSSMIARESILKNIFEESTLSYDYILIDCPPSKGILTQNAVTASSEMVIVMLPKFYSLTGLQSLLEFKSKIAITTNKNLNLAGMIINQYNPVRTLDRDVLAVIEKNYPNLMYKTRLGTHVKLSESQSAGKPINRYDRSCQSFRSYRSITKEIIDQEIPSQNKIIAS
jgi:chromosome partitioning protein